MLVASKKSPGAPARRGRLGPGETAPPFTARTAQGTPISLDTFKGTPCWLALFRYAACPFCNWRVHRMVREQDRIAAAGITVLAVFPSPSSRIGKYIDRYKPAFHVIADPDQRIYDLYQAETSWGGELRAALNVPKAARALSFAPNNPAAVDGPIHRMPAEFLLDRDHRIAVAHYGSEPDDGIDVEAALSWAASVGR
jgi:peroxiredoxin